LRSTAPKDTRSASRGERCASLCIKKGAERRSALTRVPLSNRHAQVPRPDHQRQQRLSPDQFGEGDGEHPADPPHDPELGTAVQKNGLIVVRHEKILLRDWSYQYYRSIFNNHIIVWDANCK